MAWNKKINPVKYKKSHVFLSLLLFILLLVVGFTVWFVLQKVNTPEKIETTEITNVSTEDSQEDSSIITYDSVELQKVVDDWVLNAGGNSSIVIADIDNNILAAYNADQIYFAASIYKLYVAYAGYQDIDSGKTNPDELYINGNTRAECLDIMIRESDNPCAEKYWEELGKLTLTNQLKTYGIINTNMTLTRTTAADAALILGRIARRDGLSSGSQMVYLDSMRDQIYRDGLTKGFDSENVVVYNKVGTRLPVEYHDTAVVDFADGRQLIVSVMSENVGAEKVAELGKDIQDSVLN